MFRPVMKIGKNGAWHKTKAPAILGYTDNKELYAVFPLTVDFDNLENEIEIAFTFPYTYNQMVVDIENMNKYNEWIDELYFHTED